MLQVPLFFVSIVKPNKASNKHNNTDRIIKNVNKHSSKIYLSVNNFVSKQGSNIIYMFAGGN
jgi:hypothetical protein